eukprot:TRINITY_DN24657_c0_g1_i1.p2 TRINITY_DN24657_c0_g1~~TRINITY_DN24657_c0_g1_i1.p2  ORF type:complete len:157 (+),score=31.91 TRINITY_DN24657_c0_g1_i1:252-722(+)
MASNHSASLGGSVQSAVANNAPNRSAAVVESVVAAASAVAPVTEVPASGHGYTVMMVLVFAALLIAGMHYYNKSRVGGTRKGDYRAVDGVLHGVDSMDDDVGDDHDEGRHRGGVSGWKGAATSTAEPRALGKREAAKNAKGAINADSYDGIDLDML